MLAQIDANVEQVINAPRRALHKVKRAVVGARVEIYEAGTSIDAAVYDALVGGNLLVGPFTTNGQGRVVHPDSNVLFARTQNLRIVAKKGGKTWEQNYGAVSGDELGGRELYGFASELLNVNLTTADQLLPGFTHTEELEKSIEVLAHFQVTSVTAATRVRVTLYADSAIRGGGETQQTTVAAAAGTIPLRIPLDVPEDLAVGAHTLELMGKVISGGGTIVSGAGFPASWSIKER